VNSQNVNDMTLQELAFSLGEKVTGIHRRPSDGGMVLWGFCRGRRLPLKEIRSQLEERYMARERKR